MERTDLPYLQRLFDAFYEVGALPGGGVTRLGYTELEDEMHRRFADLARSWAARWKRTWWGIPMHIMNRRRSIS